MKTIVLLSGVPYKGFKQRPQHFADVFSRKGFEVIYIGLLESIGASVEELDKINDRNSLLDLLFEKNDKQVYVLNKRDVKSKNQCRMDELLAKINEVYSEEKITYIVAFPEWLSYINEFPPNSKVIYDCMDDWEHFLKDVDFNYTEELIYKERKIASIADLVLVSANRLYVKMSYYNKNLYYLPNGVSNIDYQCIDSQIPQDMKCVEQPIVFFMGAVAEWVDIELIEYMAESRPNYSFVFVGSQRVKLPECPNIFYLGPKMYEELPNYLANSKVAIIPFKVNNLTAAVTPLKLFEYLSSGTPVVSTIMPDIIGLGGIKVAANYREFLAALDQYVSMNADEYKLECHNALRTAKEYDWDKLLDPLCNYIAEEDLPPVPSYLFLDQIVQKYKEFDQHPLIKNELLGLYCALKQYQRATELFSFEEAIFVKSGLDHEKLALAYAMQGKYSQTVDLVKISIANDERKVFIPYIDSLLFEENREELLKIFLLKLSGDTYEALKLADSLAMHDKYNLKLLGLLSSLYLDIAEYDLAFEWAVQVINNNINYAIEELFDFYTIKFIVKSLCKYSQYQIAEEIVLSLMNNPYLDWEVDAVKILSDIYINKALESGIPS